MVNNSITLNNTSNLKPFLLATQEKKSRQIRVNKNALKKTEEFMSSTSFTPLATSLYNNISCYSPKQSQRNNRLPTNSSNSEAKRYLITKPSSSPGSNGQYKEVFRDLRSMLSDSGEYNNKINNMTKLTLKVQNSNKSKLFPSEYSLDTKTIIYPYLCYNNGSTSYNFERSNENMSNFNDLYSHKYNEYTFNNRPYTTKKDKNTIINMEIKCLNNNINKSSISQINSPNNRAEKKEEQGKIEISKLNTYAGFVELKNKDKAKINKKYFEVASQSKQSKNKENTVKSKLKEEVIYSPWTLENYYDANKIDFKYYEQALEKEKEDIGKTKGLVQRVLSVKTKNEKVNNNKIISSNNNEKGRVCLIDQIIYKKATNSIEKLKNDFDSHIDKNCYLKYSQIKPQEKNMKSYALNLDF